VKNIFEQKKTNVLHSGIRELCMGTSSLAYWAAYITGIYLTLAHSSTTQKVHHLDTTTHN
jgi:hypothetical protein